MLAVQFAYHNASTVDPDKSGKQKFWTKAMMVAYLRTCALNIPYINSVYDTAMNNEPCPYPYTWQPDNVFARIHWAPMHTMGLGHVKTNFESLSKWLLRFQLNATFGKQVNLYLKSIQALRCWKYYNGYPLSVSSFGTGTWVSENYMCWARLQKFL